MRRRFVLAIALLSTSLIAGTCEFRAASNTGIQQPPPPAVPEPNPAPNTSGLLVNISVGSGDGGDGSQTASAASSARSASVLSSGAFGPDEERPRPSLASRIGEDRAFPAVVEGAKSISKPVPEPAAALLFASGLLIFGARLRSDRPAND